MRVPSFVKLCLVLLGVAGTLDWTLAITLEYTPVVESKNGPVRGIVLKTAKKSHEYHAYKGIPYAKAPIGSLRYKPPVAVEPWTEVLNATRDGPICPQLVLGIYAGQEDCLNLNVYVPKSSDDGTKSELKPVMYWIYGGAFNSGFASQLLYSPDYIIEEGAIVVAVNYRVGALGFLALEHEDVTGNAGLKDQNLGLQWVRDNIEKFGGDPQKVTIVGESAGGASVGFHTLSKKSHGLFHGSIAMSGLPLCYWAFTKPKIAKLRAYQLARKLGSTATRIEDLLEFYRTADAKSLVLATNELKTLNLPFTPTLEPVTPHAFLTKCSWEKYRTGEFNHVPQMIGYTKDEALFFAGSLDGIRRAAEYTLENLEEIGVTHNLSIFENLTDVSETISDGLVETLVKTATDLLFIAPIDYTQRALSKFADPVFYYGYDFIYEHALHKIVTNVTADGAAHADDLEMIFYSPLFKTDPRGNETVNLVQSRMTRLWANFIKYGNPTPEGKKDKLLDIVWPDSRKSGKMLRINEDLKVTNRYTNPSILLYQLGIRAFGKAQNAC